jgi:AraC-like DNA-binding protein
VVCKLFNLSAALTPARDSTPGQNGLSGEIAQFISRNLHKGLTLKLLAQFLGYSEKYCSDLFHSTMGESFSHYLKRHRTDAAATLLTTTDKSIADIASALGFSDQFAFSHFFKRATGRSPSEFRVAHTQRRPLRTSMPPIRGTR